MFLSAGLILGSHLVLKGMQKEHMIDEMFKKVEMLEKEVLEIRENDIKNGIKISDLNNTIRGHIVTIMKEREDAKRNEVRKVH